MSFPQADGSVIYEAIRKIEIVVKRARPFGSKPVVDWEPIRYEDPVQVRIWWDEVDFKGTAEQAGPASGGATSPRSWPDFGSMVTGESILELRQSIEAEPVTVPPLFLFTLCGLALRELQRAPEKGIVNEVAPLSETKEETK